MTARRVVTLVASLWMCAAPALAQHTVTFTTPTGFAFAVSVDGVPVGGSNPTLTLVAGQTYTIAINDQSTAPMFLSSVGGGSFACGDSSLYAQFPAAFSADESSPRSSAIYQFTPTWQMGGGLRYVESILCYQGLINVQVPASACPAGYQLSGNTCVFQGAPPPTCTAGFHLDTSTNMCVADPPPPPTCSSGFHLDTNTNTCVADPPPPPTCGAGFHLDPTSNTCVADPPPDPTLVLFPRVECVMPDVMDASSSIVMFGYENVGIDTVPVPFGATNQVNINGTTGSIPGEPTSFVPGLYPFAFSARLTSGQATWTLGTRAVTGDTTTPVCGLRGPKGDPGLTGVAGANGLNGAAGPKGDTGATGLTGAMGATGANGATGATGAQGPVGAPGATGSQGSAGLNGLPGATGPQGDIGLGLGFEVRHINASTTVTWPDGNRSLVYLATTSGANVVVTLPAAATSAHRFITVRRVDGGRDVRVRPAAGETINGDTAAIAMSMKDQYVTLVSDGAEWVVFAQQ